MLKNLLNDVIEIYPTNTFNFTRLHTDERKVIELKCISCCDVLINLEFNVEENENYFIKFNGNSTLSFNSSYDEKTLTIELIPKVDIFSIIIIITVLIIRDPETFDSLDDVQDNIFITYSIDTFK